MAAADDKWVVRVLVGAIIAGGTAWAARIDSQLSSINDKLSRAAVVGSETRSRVKEVERRVTQLEGLHKP